MEINTELAVPRASVFSVFRRSVGDPAAMSLASLGGKAHGLLRLTQAGLPIPRTLVIAADEFEAALQEIMHSRSVNRSQEELSTLLHACRHVATLQGQLSQVLTGWQRDSLAIRSSAVAEDGKLNSFAGILRTELDVSRANVIDAVVNCWLSTFAPAAMNYSALSKLEPTPSPIAVVIQEMLVPSAAGVCFTVDPMNPDSDNMLVEAAYGLGTSVVDGLVIPQRYLISRSSLAIEKDNTGSQEGDSEEKEAMSETQLRALARMAVNLSKLWNHALDLEFAVESNRIYLLQARPITTVAQHYD